MYLSNQLITNLITLALLEKNLYRLCGLHYIYCIQDILQTVSEFRGFTVTASFNHVTVRYKLYSTKQSTLSSVSDISFFSAL